MKKRHITTDIAPIAEDEATPTMGYSAESYIAIMKAELDEVQNLYVIAKKSSEKLWQVFREAEQYFGEEWLEFKRWRAKKR